MDVKKEELYTLPGTDTRARVGYTNNEILDQVKRLAMMTRQACEVEEEFVTCQILEGSRKFFEAWLLNLYGVMHYGQVVEQSIQIGSYGKATKSEFPPQILKWMDLDPEDLDGKVFVLVDTILDTGKTVEVALMHLLQWMRAKSCRPKKILVVSLISKVSKNQKRIEALIEEIQKAGIPIQVLAGWEVSDDKFYVGFGLDWNKKFRGLPFIIYLNEGDEEKEAASDNMAA